MNIDASQKRRLLLAGCLAIFGIFLIILTNNILNRNEEQAPNSNFFPSNAPATLLNADHLFESVEINQFNQIRSDLTFYAREHIGVEDQNIEYSVVSDVIINGSAINFRVKSNNKPNHEIDIIAEPKPWQRVFLTFTDLDNDDSSFSDKLGSNSIRNQVIANLPLQGDLYYIDFTPDADKFSVTLFDRTKQANDSAISRLQSELQQEKIDPVEYQIFAPGIFEDAPLEPENTIEGD